MRWAKDAKRIMGWMRRVLVKLYFFGGGLAALTAAALIALHKSVLQIVLGFTIFFPGLTFFFESLLMILSSRYGKLRARDNLLNSLQLNGDETRCWTSAADADCC
jgi:hypothetical protein